MNLINLNCRGHPSTTSIRLTLMTICVAALLQPDQVRAQDTGTSFALRGATIHTAAGPPIENGRA